MWKFLGSLLSFSEKEDTFVGENTKACGISPIILQRNKHEILVPSSFNNFPFFLYLRGEKDKDCCIKGLAE